MMCDFLFYYLLLINIKIFNMLIQNILRNLFWLRSDLRNILFRLEKYIKFLNLLFKLGKYKYT